MQKATVIVMSILCMAFVFVQKRTDYPSVLIGKQEWMQQNLNTNFYRNGDPILQITKADNWKEISSGAWCWYDFDSARYAGIYGKFYNWYAVNDPRGLAPAGWHIPDEDEWKQLAVYLGGDSLAGNKMKAISTLWNCNSQSIDTGNASGFSGLPAGSCDYAGRFVQMGCFAYWWTSTAYNDRMAYLHGLTLDKPDLLMSVDDKNIGFSVRCVKDSIEEGKKR